LRFSLFAIMVLAREVEAKNFVLNIGHLWDTRELVVQPPISHMKEVPLVKRFIMVLAVAALMAVTAMAAPAFALGPPPDALTQACDSSGDRAFQGPNFPDTVCIVF
jgi:hypothetical protein